MEDINHPFGSPGDAESDPSPTFRWFLGVQILWAVVVLLVTATFGYFSFESVFVTFFVGLLAGSVLFSPGSPAPRWWRVSQWLVRGGFVVLAYIILQRAQELGL